jgi:3-hydroxyisobutyrate dehydrogenase-like beta-hydroxyacid dehydrogenase
MRCGFYETFMKWSLEGDENAHRFTIANAHKDMRYLASMANEVGAVNDLQALVKNRFAAMEAEGGAQRYVPMLADFIAQRNGLPPADALRD